MVTDVRTRRASGPEMNSSGMWCDWSNSAADSRQARCSSRQFVNSLGTNGALSVARARECGACVSLKK